MQRTKWTERKFNFGLEPGLLPVTLERLRGVGARLKEMCNSLSEAELIFKPGDKWSIKEQIGHLVDLEKLHEGRIDDFLEGKEILRAADMSNSATKNAHHNQAGLYELLNAFIKSRYKFVNRLIALDDNLLVQKALHPRLQVMITPVDLAYFVAEHDDHHLTTIRELIKMQLQNANPA